MQALQREATWAEERLLGDLQQSVPQSGRVHLHIIETLEINFRVVKMVFLGNGVFVPCQKQVVLTKNGENDDLHSTKKIRGCAPQTPETDEMTNMAGVPQTNHHLLKTPFSPPKKQSTRDSGSPSF